MIARNAEPVAHVSPYKRIEFGAETKKPEPKWTPRKIPPEFEELLP
jgi:hypothetical protein